MIRLHNLPLNFAEYFPTSRKKSILTVASSRHSKARRHLLNAPNPLHHLKVAKTHLQWKNNSKVFMCLKIRRRNNKLHVHSTIAAPSPGTSNHRKTKTPQSDRSPYSRIERRFSRQRRASDQEQPSTYDVRSLSEGPCKISQVKAGLQGADFVLLGTWIVMIIGHLMTPSISHLNTALGRVLRTGSVSRFDAD